MNLFIKGRYGVACLQTDTGPLFLSFEGETDKRCEWHALVMGMIHYSGHLSGACNFYTDSMVLFRQLHGEYHIKSKNLKPIYFEWNQFKNILSGNTITYKYISGYDNPARKAIDEWCGYD